MRANFKERLFVFEVSLWIINKVMYLCIYIILIVPLLVII